MAYHGDLFDEARSIVAGVLDLDEEDLTEDAGQEAYGRWTSLNHMIMMASLENHFGVTLTTADMAQMTTLGTIVSVLERELSRTTH